MDRASKYVKIKPTTAAKILGIDVKTLRAMELRGEGPEAIRYGPRLIHYSLESCVKWAEEQRLKHARARNQSQAVPSV